MAPTIALPSTTTVTAAVQPALSIPQWKEQLGTLKDKLAQPPLAQKEPRVGSAQPTQRMPHGLPRSNGQALDLQKQRTLQNQQPNGLTPFYGIAFVRVKEFLRARLTDDDRDVIRIIVTLNQLSRGLVKYDTQASKFNSLPVKAQMQAVWFWVVAQDKMALFDIAILLHISQDFLWTLIEHFAQCS